jgi:hypothetical protein
LLLAYSKYL